MYSETNELQMGYQKRPQTNRIVCFYVQCFTVGFLYLLLLTGFHQGWSQTRFLLLEENFEDNQNNWLMGNRAKTNAYMANGLFHVEGKRAGYNYSKRIIGGYLRDFQDFEIEVKIRQTGGIGNRGYALEWGGNSIDNTFYEFWLRKDGSYSIDKFDGRTKRFVDYVPWRRSEVIHTSGFNILTVQKVGTSLTYQINGNTIFRTTFEKLFGNEIGVIVPPLGTIEVDYLKITLLDEPEPVFSKEYTPQIYAVIIGVANYQNDSQFLPDLRFTVADALSVSNFYTHENGGGVPKENISLLLDEEATYENILGETERLFSKARKDDLIVFYFAGHGTVSSRSGNPHLHLLPYDFKNPDLNTAIIYKDIENIFDRSQAGKKVWIMDACHSGGTLEQLSGNIKDHLRSLVDKEIAIITSSDVHETSLEIPFDINRGLFSYHLTNGLVTDAGQCDANQDGVVDILELFGYVKSKTSKMAFEIYKHHQNPQIGGKFNIRLPIANVMDSVRVHD